MIYSTSRIGADSAPSFPASCCDEDHRPVPAPIPQSFSQGSGKMGTSGAAAPFRAGGPDSLNGRDTRRPTPFFVRSLPENTIRPDGGCNRSFKAIAFNSVSELDPASPQSLGKVKDDIAQSPPLAVSYGCPRCGADVGHHWWCCNWLPPLGKPPRVSAYECAAVHRENTSDGAGAWAGAVLTPVCFA